MFERKILGHVIADAVEHLAVGVRKSRPVRRIDDDAPPSSTTGSILYMPLEAVQMSSYNSGMIESTVLVGAILRNGC
jgi:hypothetical protein